MDQPATTAMGWKAFGATARGGAHVRDGRPNQDAIAWLPESGEGCPLALAVADGHGSAQYVRSEVGAFFAVQVATRQLLALELPTEQAGLSLVKRAALEQLPHLVVRQWEAQVRDHLALYPLEPEELDWIAATSNNGERRRREIEENPVRAYGTTLLAALVNENYLIYLQLGDGEILVVGDDGAVVEPVPRDPRLIANETFSLCEKHAWSNMRVGFQPLAGAPPALVLLSTDGYSNSFSTETDVAAFRRVGSDILDLLRRHGVDAVAGDAPTWLGDAAAVGGDDATLAVVCRLDALTTPSRPHIAVAELTAPDTILPGAPEPELVSAAPTQAESSLASGLALKPAPSAAITGDAVASVPPAAIDAGGAATTLVPNADMASSGSSDHPDTELSAPSTDNPLDRADDAAADDDHW